MRRWLYSRFLPFRLILIICVGLSVCLTACTLSTTDPNEQILSPTSATTLVSLVTPVTVQPSPTPTFTLTPFSGATSAPVNTHVPAGATLVNCTPRADWVLIYVVVTGDNLSKIAQMVGSSVQALQQGNCLVDANQIVVGKKLRVPSLPPTLAPTLTPSGSSGNPVGGVDLSEIISGDAGVVYLLRDSTITLIWTNAPTGLANVSFVLVGANYPNGTDTTIHATLGTLTNPTFPVSISWKVPAGLKAENIVAQGQFKDSMYLYYSLPITVNSAPSSGQGCEVSPATGRVNSYMQPNASSEVFGFLDPGQYIEVLGRSLNGWYGFDPGAGGTGIARLRWLPVDGSYVTRGFC
ncbi:MAG TPA: LysM peptidoglycan-binding domain-containing protein [Phototrophicaceae bacterium]|jgi:LysM repeat protein|nr:LysM peptidoglycan-binding domain-containing protein [Phototrophicaceae bacterium]